jgi:hypothetical protein
VRDDGLRLCRVAAVAAPPSDILDRAVGAADDEQARIGAIDVHVAPPM